ncbi:TIGR00725 family protein [Bartonella tamiae]|uniref:TIGR00725 family protein n=1 Tax=Bartonella tamiae Th239 TaxID=1094558 RepID=J0ZLB4_9HYPH|nr:TIGR00725 family protein [Bartonella tamiae]EJF89198.1 TIGR00725 family protein [Bartonella tamiae Th239]EJF95399.1 TIGR00725 family protein [Bartonella tamiae Th307]
MDILKWSEETSILIKGNQFFDGHSLKWKELSEVISGKLTNVNPLQALKKLAEGNSLRRVPIAIIGPRDATKLQYKLAEDLGRAYALYGLQLICGGKNGVMEAACKGHLEAGGTPIGLLPDGDFECANPYVSIPIATGIGPARNALIARAALVLVAVGGGVGTISEMALGLQFERKILAMKDAPQLNGVIYVETVEEAILHIANKIFDLSGF